MLKPGGFKHGIDQIVDFFVTEFIGLGRFYERIKEFTQLGFVHFSVLVVVAHVENDAKFVIGFSSGKQNNGIQELLEMYFR